jgi:hypothetical protein
MLGRWQGTFCAGISTRNFERGVRGVDYVVNVRSFAILSQLFCHVILSQIKILVIEARITCIL